MGCEISISLNAKLENCKDRPFGEGQPLPVAPARHCPLIAGEGRRASAGHLVGEGVKGDAEGGEPGENELDARGVGRAGPWESSCPHRGRT